MTEPIDGVALPTGWRGFVARAVVAGLRASSYVSPRPIAWAIRRLFAKNGAQLAAALQAGAPPDVVAVIDEPYGDQRRERLDVYTPAATTRAGGRLPTVVWTHGGGFVGGSKDEIAGYLQRIAAAGFTVVGVEYTLAPGATYPTPVRQVMAALRHLAAHADRLHVDPTHLVLAGDSAGAHITAQVAAAATDPRYAEQIGVRPSIVPDQLRGVVLCCGVYDLALIAPGGPFRAFVDAVGWAYTGSRHFRTDDQLMSTMAIPHHVTAAFPPAFVTAGNADPLVAHSETLVAALESHGVEVEALLYAPDHQPPLPHEYQFDLSLEDGSLALQRVIAFAQRQTRAD